METLLNTLKSAVGLTPAPDNMNKIIRLACQVQPYGYGKVGSNSLASRLALSTPENNFHLDESQTYGEGPQQSPYPSLLWIKVDVVMDERPRNGPYKSVATGTDLHTLIKTSPQEFLGEK